MVCWRTGRTVAAVARTLCFGGSFNPVHHGHLLAARAAAEAAGFDRVRLIVAGDPPHKPESADLAPAADRVEMCRLAVTGDPFFEVDDRETRRDGPSYTATTAEEFGPPVDWLIGADLLASLPRWHRAAELLSDPPTLVRFVVMARGGYEIDWPNLPAAVRHLRANAVTVPRVEVSATHLRQRLAAGLSVRYLTPDRVVPVAARLYAAQPPPAGALS